MFPRNRLPKDDGRATSFELFTLYSTPERTIHSLVDRRIIVRWRVGRDWRYCEEGVDGTWPSKWNDDKKEHVEEAKGRDAESEELKE